MIGHSHKELETIFDFIDTDPSNHLALLGKVLRYPSSFLNVQSQGLAPDLLREPTVEIAARNLQQFTYVAENQLLSPLFKALNLEVHDIPRENVSAQHVPASFLENPDVERFARKFLYADYLLYDVAAHMFKWNSRQ